jgi:hypothetical protein
LYNSSTIFFDIINNYSLLQNLQMPCDLHSSSGVGGSGQHGNDNENLPPPPPPTPEQLMAMLAEGQRAMGEALRTMA